MAGRANGKPREKLWEFYDALPADMQAELQSKGRTLGQALFETARERWQGRRCYASATAQAFAAVQALGGEHVPLASIKLDDIKAAVKRWVASGLASGTIHHRLNALKALGVPIDGARPRRANPLKWWLDPDTAERLCALLAPKIASGDLFRVVAVFAEGDCLFPVTILPPPPFMEQERENQLFRDYVEWTRATGLRVEETLRLRRSHFSDQFRSVTVPGTKTSRSQAALPLSSEAQEIAARRFSGHEDGDARMFPIRYGRLALIWRCCRKELGITDPLATLKAFRRGAARRLHAQNGMPLDILRQYLRHGNVQTTMGYLRLTGGYSEEETRRWLK